MPISMMAIYRRPEGGDQALETFRERYVNEHLPLMHQVPGLRTIRVERVVKAYDATDIVMIAELLFDTKGDFEMAMASAEMRAAGRNLREIAQGTATLVLLEPESVTATTAGSVVLDGLLETEENAEPAPSRSSLDAAFGRSEDDR